MFVAGLIPNIPSEVNVALSASKDDASDGSSEVGIRENTFEMPEYSGVQSGST